MESIELLNITRDNKMVSAVEVQKAERIKSLNRVINESEKTVLCISISVRKDGNAGSYSLEERKSKKDNGDEIPYYVATINVASSESQYTILTTFKIGLMELLREPAIKKSDVSLIYLMYGGSNTYALAYAINEVLLQEKISKKIDTVLVEQLVDSCDYFKGLYSSDKEKDTKDKKKKNGKKKKKKK